jgi:hypothetical protein
MEHSARPRHADPGHLFTNSKYSHELSAADTNTARTVAKMAAISAKDRIVGGYLVIKW